MLQTTNKILEYLLSNPLIPNSRIHLPFSSTFATRLETGESSSIARLQGRQALSFSFPLGMKTMEATTSGSSFLAFPHKC